jgi:hypothetical protein
MRRFARGSSNRTTTRPVGTDPHAGKACTRTTARNRDPLAHPSCLSIALPSCPERARFQQGRDRPPSARKIPISPGFLPDGDYTRPLELAETTGEERAGQAWCSTGDLVERPASIQHVADDDRGPSFGDDLRPPSYGAVLAVRTHKGSLLLSAPPASSDSEPSAGFINCPLSATQHRQTIPRSTGGD